MDFKSTLLLWELEKKADPSLTIKRFYERHEGKVKKDKYLLLSSSLNISKSCSLEELVVRSRSSKASCHTTPIIPLQIKSKGTDSFIAFGKKYYDFKAFVKENNQHFLSHTVISKRLRDGWSFEESVSIPFGQKRMTGGSDVFKH